MHQGYIYDVFISYRHDWPVCDWIVNHFQRLLGPWLSNNMPYRPSVFIDFQIEAGTEWPASIRQALLTSRCLVTVWSPEYFRSEWCTSELQTMLRREKLLGLRTNRKPSSLIYPVLYCGAECLPSYVRAIQYKDMSEWNYPYLVFKETALYLEFDRQMQKLCKELAKMILSAPPWQVDWPLVTPEISQTEISQSMPLATTSM